MAVIAVKPLNALLLGETYARSMGVAVERNRIWLIACTAVLAGAVTAFSGRSGSSASPGLTWRGASSAPRITGCWCRAPRSWGPRWRCSDVLTQLPGGSRALPLNSITALLGAPVMVSVILARRRLYSAAG